MALPPQYQQKPVKLYALQFNGTNQQAIKDFGKAWIEITPEGALMQKGNPYPFVEGEWLVQWSNTEKRGVYERWNEAAFGQTWQPVVPAEI